MKHIKAYKIFESLEDDLLEIKELFQEVSDEWDFSFISLEEFEPMIKNALRYNVLSGGGYYTVTSGRENKRAILVYLPHKQLGQFYTSIKKSIDMKKFSQDVDKFISIVKSIGYNPNIIWDKRDDSVLYIIDF